MPGRRRIALAALALAGFAGAAGGDCLAARADTTGVESAAPSSPPAYRAWHEPRWPICRAFADYLDRLPKIDPALACDLDGRLAAVGITQPRWVDLDLGDYRDVVYAIEMALPPASRGGQELLAGSIGTHPPRGDGPYSLPFADWHRNYAANVQAGYVRPRLRGATLALSPPDPPLAVLAYTTERDNENACKRSAAAAGSLAGKRLGEHLFPYDPAGQSLRSIVSSEVVVSSRLRYRAVDFEGRTYLIGTNPAGPSGGFTMEFSRIEGYGGDGPQDPLYAGYHLCGFSVGGESPR